MSLQSRTNTVCRAKSTIVKMKIHKTMLKVAAVCGSETWAVAAMDMISLGTWNRKI